MATLEQHGLEGLLERLSLDSASATSKFPVAPANSGTSPLTRPQDIFRSFLANALADVAGCDFHIAQEAIVSTADTSLGDFSVAIPRLRIEGQEVQEVGKKVVDNFPANPYFDLPFLENKQLRFFLSTQILPELLLTYIKDRGATYGNDSSFGASDDAGTTTNGNTPTPTSSKKRVIVEFSSPNLTEFNDKHLRSTLLGAFIANLHEAMGWEVVRMNYLGDWNKPLALLLGADLHDPTVPSISTILSSPQMEAIEGLHRRHAAISAAFAPEEAAVKLLKRDASASPADVAALESTGLFAQRDAFFARLEAGDSDAVDLWRRAKDVYIADLRHAYERFGIGFQTWTAESEVGKEAMEEVERLLEQKGVLEEREGARLVDFAKHGGRKGSGVSIVRTKSGSSTYLLRDLASVLERDRREGGFDKMIYVVAAQQDAYFTQMFDALDLMGRPDLKSKVLHVNFGRVQSIPDGIQGLGGVLEGTARIMREAMMEEVDDQAIIDSINFDVTSISALLTQDMSGRRGHGYAWDEKKMTTFEADTGLKLQRCHSLLTTSISDLRLKVGDETPRPDFEALRDDNSADILRLMAVYPDVTAATMKTLEPHTILSYLFRLVWSVCAALEPAEGEEDEGVEDEDAGEGPSNAAKVNGDTSSAQHMAKLILYECARQVLENGMNILGFRRL